MAIQVKFDSKKIFHIKQLEVWNNFLEDGINVLACGRRWGKSYFAMYVLLLYAMAKVGNYFWVSPTFKMSRDPWRRMKKVVTKTTNGTAQINETDKRITLPNGSVIEFHSADDPQSLRSQGLRGVVMDEAAKINIDAWTQAIKPSLTDYDDSWAILIGTPFGLNWFWEIYEEGRKGINNTRSWNYTSYDNPKISKKKIDLDKITMSDREFRQEHLAEFLTDAGVIFKREHLSHRVESVDCYKRFISLDTASTVNSKSAYSCAVIGELTFDKKLFIKHVERKKLEFTQLQYWIESLAEQYNTDGKLEMMIIEYASSGISTVQSLRATSKPEVARLISPFIPKQSKAMRGYEASSFMEKAVVLYPLYSEQTKWLAEYEDELLSFTGSGDEFKDMADATNQLIKVLAPALTDGLLYGKK